MRAWVNYEDERLLFEPAGDILIADWQGPAALSVEESTAAIRAALEAPLGFPPVGQMLVPGDRVTLAIDQMVCDVGPVVEALAEVFRDREVELEDVEVVLTPEAGGGQTAGFPSGMRVERHDPSALERLAYLASTREGRRVYLNRRLTDADVVIPVGRLGYDPVLGYRGPWSVVFPGLSNEETRASYRRRLREDLSAPSVSSTVLDEVFEVNWLLGAPFHLGLVPGVTGLAGVVAGGAEQVRDRGIGMLDRLWSFQASERAEVVVAGIGRPGQPTGIEELVEGLVTASRLVSQGGKIIALSQAQGPIGPGMRRLIDAGDPRRAPAALKGHEGDVDSVAARRLAGVLAWADVFLLSRLEGDLVEDLSMVPLDRAEDARRLAARSHSCILISQAELTRASASE